MSTTWGLLKADPTTLEVVDDADAFDAEPWDPQELDLLFVGTYEGPVSELFYAGSFSTIRADNHSVISQEALQKCAEWLSRIPRDRFAPLETFLSNCFHSYFAGRESSVYEGAIESAKEFRNFIESAAAAGNKLRLWVAA